ncbi:C39 family peptidase [Neobacillus mesonae]|uniref:Hydrolase n=1 Tax=Neobacillus mesonae TaxID=1193713 RepID=A0A3Q9QUF6_9BACI|nr:C39 family peptidase [Neobacillus mesonae]AZU60834.1 hydrolase [Neobacillus mesonae]
MKKWLMIVIILAISIFGVKTIIDVKADQADLVMVKEAPTLKLRQIALQKNAPILPKSKLLDVPFINQMDHPMLYNGCEVTSLAMILNYHGVRVSKNELAEKIKTVPLNYPNGQKGNPNAGFVGNMARGPGLGVYNGPIYDLAKKYVGDKAVNLTNSPFTDLLKKVSQGLPVWIITTSSFTPVSVFETWNTPQGKIEITFSEHSVAITGYDDKYIYVNDPYGVKNRKCDRERFIKAWEQMGSQAVVIEK